jgi:cytochrome c biogenesis protein CcmG, thiol:disulfide interchange protein DsbE
MEPAGQPVTPIDPGDGAELSETSFEEPGAGAPSLRVLWRWFRFVGVPVIAVTAIATAILLIRAGSSDGNGAVALDPATLDQSEANVSTEVGAMAPDFALQTADGRTYRLSELRGQAVVINFWATWCGPCRGEMPAIEEAAMARAGDGLVVLAVNVRESAGQVQPYVTKLGLTFPVLLDPSGKVSARYRVGALPTTYLIDREGRIDGFRIGPYTKSMLLARLDQLLGTE